ncbi:MAG: ATP-binding cassette domain-containing protein [Gemmatimonadota bacterium]
MSVALDAESLQHDYAGVIALRGVTVTVPAGHLLAVVGESGSGKTTLLRSFNRMVEPRQGIVRVGGEDVQTIPAELLRRRLGYVPQMGGLLPHWTIRRNVALVPRLIRAPDPGRAADEALELVGLSPAEFGARYPHELSGGQRQRAALARALAARQEVVLLDEPFGALDSISRAEVYDAFVRVRRELRFTAILVTHDLSEAARLADAVAVMRDGRVEQVGSARELRESPATPYVAALLAQAMAAGSALVTA